MTKPTERVRAIIRDARRSIGSPDNAPAVANAILSQMWTAVTADQDVLRHLLARGLNAEIRAFLSRHYDEKDGSDAKQLVRLFGATRWGRSTKPPIAPYADLSQLQRAYALHLARSHRGRITLAKVIRKTMENRP